MLEMESLVQIGRAAPPAKSSVSALDGEGALDQLSAALQLDDDASPPVQLWVAAAATETERTQRQRAKRRRAIMER